jgi:hypothetical protein
MRRNHPRFWVQKELHIPIIAYNGVQRRPGKNHICEYNKRVGIDPRFRTFKNSYWMRGRGKDGPKLPHLET